MITATMTKHAIHDRAERLAFIAEYVGVGTIQYRFPSEQSEQAEYCITSTGVLIVRNINSNSIINNNYQLRTFPTKERFIFPNFRILFIRFINLFIYRFPC